jgi:hypothetical protein
VKSDKDPELSFQISFSKLHGKGTRAVVFVFILALTATVGKLVVRCLWLHFLFNQLR